MDEGFGADERNRFDALIFGKRDPIENLPPENTPKDGVKLFSFKLRDPWVLVQQSGVGSTVPKYLENIATRTDLSFTISNRAHGETEGRLDAHGRIIPGCQMMFSIHLYEPLLRSDLTTSEKLVQQFRATKTVGNPCWVLVVTLLIPHILDTA
jgi:hypothetical protein